MIELPAPQTVSESVTAWAATNPELAAFLATNPTVHLALAQWGMLLLKQGRAADAALIFRSALALRPADPVLWINCGISLDQSNLFSDAVACFEKSLELAPRQPDAWLLLGLTRKKQGEAAAAEAAYRQALKLAPALAVAWQCLGMLKEEQKEYPAAIENYNACIQHGGAGAPVFATLGKLHHQTGKFPEAYEAFKKAVEFDAANAHYREMLRKTRFLSDVLKNLPVEDIVSTYRASFSSPETCAEADLIKHFDKCIALLGGFGHLESALRLGRKRLEFWPTASSTTEYLLQAMSGDAGLARSPARFIVEHFDASAENFDAHLVNDLGYQIPAELAGAVRAVTPAGHFYDALDAGCGTGLCGPLLRPLARRLAGVDLSPKMLEQAAKRGIYDETACEELTVFLNRSHSRFDLVVAADVFIYFGDLMPIFNAAAEAIRPGGLLAFSTESGADAGYRLLPSGRFAHAPEYVRTAAGGHFTQELCTETTIRLEAVQRLRGNLFLFRRR